MRGFRGIFGGLGARARAWLAGGMLGLGALVLFVWNIARPAVIYFDEAHYVPAARALLARSGPVNIEHPLFAKTLIAASIALFGDNALAWRLPSLMFGVASVVGLFWIALLLFKDLRCAVCAGLLLVFNQTLFVQARIAMLEMPMMGCLVLGLGCWLQAAQPGAHARRWSYAGAGLLGLAVGAKWLAAPYVLLALAARVWWRWRESGRDRALLTGNILPDAAKLGGVAALVYLATFFPAFFYTHDAMTWRHLFSFQFEMLAEQRLPLAAHPYQSDWWKWPVMARPIWYLFDQNAGAYHAILLVGNPVIYWGGLAMAAFAASGWMMRRDRALMATVGLWVFSLAVWVVIPKQIGFFYYYNLSGVWLCLVAVAFLRLFDAKKLRLLWWFTALSAAMFVYFYPVIAGDPLPTDDTWTQWMWFKGWL